MAINQQKSEPQDNGAPDGQMGKPGPRIGDESSLQANSNNNVLK